MSDLYESSRKFIVDPQSLMDLRSLGFEFTGVDPLGHMTELTVPEGWSRQGDNIYGPDELLMGYFCPDQDNPDINRLVYLKPDYGALEAMTPEEASRDYDGLKQAAEIHELLQGRNWPEIE